VDLDSAHGAAAIRELADPDPAGRRQRARKHATGCRVLFQLTNRSAAVVNDQA